MSSAYYLANPISNRGPSPPAAAMSVTVDDLPTLTLLYKLKKIEAKKESAYVPSATFNNKISVIRQDITTLAVDAIVNAANTSLLGGGGVDGAIHRAAGPELVEECETLDGCETGSAKITEGYELPAKKVIHAVGPIYWKKGPESSAALLAGCYKTSLQLAVDNGCKSIAFAALSTGVYGYPSYDASIVALKTVRDFLESEDGDSLERIIFCNFLPKDEDAYFENIPDYFPPIGVESEVTKEQPTSTQPSEVMSQLPDAPTEDPKDVEKPNEPSPEKQNVDDTDDDFVVVEKEDAKEEEELSKS